MGQRIACIGQTTKVPSREFPERMRNSSRRQFIDMAHLANQETTGNVEAWTGSRFRYTGQTALPEAQLYYYKARVFDPKLGRFLQTDPVGSKADLNLCAYVNNDPINQIDPSGEVPGDLFSTPAAAAKDALLYINPTSKAENREYGGVVNRVKVQVTDSKGNVKEVNRYVASEPEAGTGDTAPHRVSIRDTVAIYHTHGDWSKAGANGQPERVQSKKEDTYDGEGFSRGKGDFAVAQQAANLTAASRAVHGEKFKSWLDTPEDKIKSHTPRQ